MRKIKQHVKVGDRVRHRDTGWTGEVVKTHGVVSGQALQSGGHQDAKVRWDQNGRVSLVTLVAATLTVVTNA